MIRSFSCGLVLAMLLAACSHFNSIKPAPVATTPAAAPAPIAPPAAAQSPIAPAEPPMAPPLPPPPAPGRTAAPARNPADAPLAARHPPAAKPAAPPPQPASAAATAPAPPALNLASLEQRLRDTRAIGVFTKLSLKNQVDDLLDQFRALYRGQVSIPLAKLRQSYDLLMLKVLSLLQDSDPLLANDIVASREAIWGVLKDPAKFATIS
jgi:hypothetical protein